MRHAVRALLSPRLRRGSRHRGADKGRSSAGPSKAGSSLTYQILVFDLGEVGFFRDRLGINRGSNCASWDQSRSVLFLVIVLFLKITWTIFFTQWSAGGVAALFRRHRSRPLPAHGCANPRSGRQRARMACRRSVEPK